MPQYQRLSDSAMEHAKVLLSKPENTLIVQTILGRRSKDLLQKIVVKYGLTATQYEILYGLYICPNCNQSQLGSFLYLDNAAVTRQVVALEEGGYLVRGRDETDRRASTLKLSEDSEAILPEIEEKISNLRVELFEGFSKNQQKSLLEILEKLHNNLDRSVEYEF
ncbi:MarR family transcriptional regulator [bacterium]|nr:MarR family transcriptional regulator [bacterium]